MKLADANSCEGPGLVINSDEIQTNHPTQNFWSNVSNHLKVGPNDSKENISCAMAPHYQKGSLALHCNIQALR